MPIGAYKPLGVPATATAPSGPSTLQRVLAGGTRMASGVLASEGGLLGAGIAGAGEGIAEGIEGDTPDWKRVGVEAGLGAVPFGEVIKAGKPIVSTVRSGLFSGAGEAMREKARGEDLDLPTIAKTSALGAIFGNVFGRLGGKAPEPSEYQSVSPRSIPGLENSGAVGGGEDWKGKQVGTPQRGSRITVDVAPPEATPTPTVDPRTAYWQKQGMNPPTAPGRMASPQFDLPFDAAEPMQDATRIPNYESGSYPTGSALKSQNKEIEVLHGAGNRMRKDELGYGQQIDKTLQSTLGKLLSKAPIGPKNITDIDKGITQAGQAGSDLRQGVLDDIVATEKGHTAADTMLGREAKQTEKEATEAAARKRIADAIAQGGLEPGDTTVSESGSIPTPSGRARFNQSWKAPNEAEEDLDTFGGSGKTPPPAEPDLPIAEPYSDGQGMSVEFTGEPPVEAVAPKSPREPKTPTLKQQAQQESYAALLAKLKAEAGGVAAPPVEPTGEPPVTPEGPSSEAPIDWEAEHAKARAAQADADARNEAMAAWRKGPQTPNAATQWPDPTAPHDVADVVREDEAANERARQEWDAKFAHLNTPPAAPEAPPVAPEAPAESPMARLFKSRADAAGTNYREIKAALGTEPALNEPTLLTDPKTGKPITPKNIAGMNMRREGRAAVGRGEPVPPAAQPPTSEYAGWQDDLDEGGFPLYNVKGGKFNDSTVTQDTLKQEKIPFEDPPASDERTQAQLQRAQELKAEGLDSNQIIERIKSEGGSISPAMLARLGLSAVGATLGGLAGGATGHPFLGAALGAGAGALGPDAIVSGLKSIGVAGPHAEAFKEHLSTPEGVSKYAKSLFSTLPQIQRFNYLADTMGLPANMWAGPYGSATMAGLESMLSGDPRGLKLLKTLTPQRFAQEWTAARDEAARLIAEGNTGRAETQALGSGSKLAKILQLPGVGMTAGDVAARKILMDAGFSDEEARVITLTSEPEMEAPRKLANLSKGSPMLQLLQPFARTPANIAEQGAYRIPVLGSIVQHLGRETPDPLRRQLVQQGLGGLLGVGSAMASSQMDPSTERNVRRFATNFGGQYSLPVGIGMAIGQAMHEGKPIVSGATLGDLNDALPLPATTSLAQWERAATTGVPPRGSAPSALLDLFGTKAGDTSLKSVAEPTFPRFRRIQ